MTVDPQRRIANRRKTIAYLREMAVRSETLAAEYRANADRMEASTDALELPATGPGEVPPTQRSQSRQE